MKKWAHRVRPQAVSPEMQQVRNAVQDLAQHAGHIPGRAGNTLRMAAESVMVGAVILSGIVSGVHLYRSFFPRHRDDRPEHEPQQQGGRDDRPPHRHITIAAGRPGEGRGHSRD